MAQGILPFQYEVEKKRAGADITGGFTCVLGVCASDGSAAYDRRSCGGS